VTPLAWGLVCIAAVAAVVDWVAVFADLPGVERVAKPLVLVSLLVASVVLVPVGSGVRPWLSIALAASLAGDVLLLPPGRFVPALVAFMVAQLAYLVVFVQLPGSPVWLVLGIALAFGLVLTVGHEIVEGARKARLELAVGVYLAAICGMAITATRTGIPLAALFVASDATLGWDRFAARPASSPREARLRRLAVMVTYHLGQVLLVVALAA